jgi:hypothetical protein
MAVTEWLGEPYLQVPLSASASGIGSSGSGDHGGQVSACQERFGAS